ncbi:uncharacterized protein Z520_00638 [Fonsecaea multimorphosa CBS 102226]|uniref:Alpha-1,3-mannosyltransferase n=1 Tax=Fonsecaea multimorphosa CBS 102226 TaxID=1442371 RepID=A0A0D2HQ00_9EURO|nr:uncharacterized protein Z520_00638 [Fonsecaea multimorphosa CBS 102226]KIY03946.1 hypothetical protein Z520_00638 [Fonsecaea multimorphosa CBS 102226]OAL31786.1 hypothetical protein AYO22_00656 [Fonsecaea multimorphosa]
MPPHLHPRSTATSTLFAGTLLASFIVVGIPHVFPCPRPRTGYAADAGRATVELDEDGNPVVRRGQARRLEDKPSTGKTPAEVAQEKELPQSKAPQPQPRTKGLTASKALDEEAALFRELQAEAEALETQARSARECPVPKPRGWVGRMLGFEEQQGRKEVVAGKEGG